MGYNRRVFLLWDTTEKGFPPLWDTTEEDFFRCGIQRRTISGWQKKCFYCIPQRRKFFSRCILHHNRILCSVLYPRKIFRIVSNNAAGFLSLYPTMEEAFLHCGIQRKRFFPLWDTMEKNYIQRIMIFLNFKCL